MPFSAYTNAAYFTPRSGGQTLITFLLAICLSLNLIQCAIGAFMIQRGNGYKI